MPTFPALFQTSGYTTFAVGKQHFDPIRDHRGYGRLLLSEDRTSYRADDDYLLDLQTAGYGDVTDPWGSRGPGYYTPQTSKLPPELHVTAWTARRCAELIRANRNRRFLGMASFLKPHPPLDPPRSYLERYPFTEMNLPPQLPTDWSEPDDFLRVQNLAKNMTSPSDEHIRAARAGYFALVEQLDDGIGVILTELQRSGIYDDTLVIFSSDHGELLGDHRAWGKRSFYEGAARVPFILHWPAGMPAGSSIETPISNIDIFPTLCAAAHIDISRPVDGVSLLPLACNGKVPDRLGSGVAAEHGEGRGQKLMWRWQEGTDANMRQWKYVWLANGGREQLFDLTSDPNEHRNLARSEPNISRTAHAELVSWCKATGFQEAISPDGGLVNMPFQPLAPTGEGAPLTQSAKWPRHEPTT